MKKIGILAWKLGDIGLGVTTPYINYFEHFGEVVFIKHDEEVRPDIDLLVLPGGPDVNPKRYGEKPHIMTGRSCLQREYFDLMILPEYIELGTPIFGICRGFQTMVVALGGKLIQHMHHETNDAKKRGERVHSVVFKSANKPGYSWIAVNSIHHQVADEASLPEELKVIARHIPANATKGDNVSFYTNGTIEGLVHRTKPIALVQYHPEELITNTLANNLVETLLDNPKNVNNLYDEIKPGQKIQGKNKVEKSHS